MICTTVETRTRNKYKVLTNQALSKRTTNNAVTEYIAAGSPSTPVQQLTKLAKSPDGKVRRQVAENPNCPLSILFLLLSDDLPEVRESIASNPIAPFSLIECLLGDLCAEVRFALAEDHHLPADFLIRLCLDENPYVANRAQITVSHLQSNKLALAA